MKITDSTGINASGYSRMQDTNGANQDNRLKSIQKQIENVQKQLQSLSDNKDLSLEEKMERRKELQQQLQDLNRQMSQRKIEIMQEKREKSTVKVEKQEVPQGNTDKQEFNVIGTATLQGIISADTSMKQVKTVQSVKTSIEGRAGVLESEIKMDKGRRGSTESKEAELAELNEHIDTASADIMDKISDIDMALEKSREKKDEDKTDKAETANQEERLSGSEGGKLTLEIVKKAENSTQTQVSGDQAEGQYVDVTV